MSVLLILVAIVLIGYCAVVLLVAHMAQGRVFRNEARATRNAKITGGVGAALLLFSLAACAKPDLPPPEPQIVIKEVLKPVAVPCAALAALGPEPAYPDTDVALKAAPNLFTRVRLMAQGRLLRVARLIEYGAAKRSCQ